MLSKDDSQMKQMGFKNGTKGRGSSLLLCTSLCTSHIHCSGRFDLSPREDLRLLADKTSSPSSPPIKVVRLQPNSFAQPRRPCMAGLERSLFPTLEFEREA